MKKVLAFVLFIGMAGHANAAIFDAGAPGSFSYGGFTWDTAFSPTGNNDGFIGTGVDAGVGDVQIVGSDTGDFADASSNMTTAITESGTISVAWDYFTFDPPALFDPFVWLLDGVEQAITGFDEFLGGGQTGTFTQHVDAGTVFGFAIVSDNLLGQPPGAWSADVGLSLFSFTPNPVPIPAAVLLFGTALVGFIGVSRRRKVA